MINNYGIHLSKDGNNLLLASIVSIFLVGGAIGSLCGALIADRIGRKGSFMICNILFFIGSLCFLSCRSLHSIGLIILGRFIVGLASGLTTSTVPMYLSEIAPIELRGTMGVLCSMGVTGGVVVGQIMSLNPIFGTDHLWHYALSFYVVLVICCSLPYTFLPESPKYLYVIANRRDAATSGMFYSLYLKIKIYNLLIYRTTILNE